MRSAIGRPTEVVVAPGPGRRCAIVALAILRLPGDEDSSPAKGLSAGGPSAPNVVPGVILARLVTIGSGLVLAGAR